MEIRGIGIQKGDVVFSVMMLARLHVGIVDIMDSVDVRGRG